MSYRRMLRSEMAITEETRRTMPIPSVPVPTNFRRSSSRIASGGGGIGSGFAPAFPPAAGTASSAIGVEAAVAHLNVANGLANCPEDPPPAQSLYRAPLFQRDR